MQQQRDLSIEVRRAVQSGARLCVPMRCAWTGRPRQPGRDGAGELLLCTHGDRPGIPRARHLHGAGRRYRMIAFLWPHLLWLEAIVPVLAAAFVGALRRRRKRAAPAALSFLPGRAAWHGPPWRVRLAPALLAVTLAMLIVATARPTATLTLPSRQQTVILALDVSGSMQAGDVAPNRITAAQASAKAFASRLPRHVRVGVVA